VAPKFSGLGRDTSISPGAQLQALTELEAGAPQFPTDALSDKSTAGLRRTLSLEYAGFRRPAVSGDRAVPTSVAAGHSRGLIRWPSHPPKLSRILEVLGPSRWLHVLGSGSSKWCAAEGDAVVDQLRPLLDKGIEEPDVFVIKPL
jgi:hypothetical protein